MAEGKKMTKAQIISDLADKTGLTKKQIQGVFEALLELIKHELGRRGPGEFVIPDMLKLKIRKTLAQKGKKFRNPQWKEGDPPNKQFTVKDVPAGKKLRATPLKKFKDNVLA
jgi:nucleoid DNA-binding protein